MAHPKIKSFKAGVKFVCDCGDGKIRMIDPFDNNYYVIWCECGRTYHAYREGHYWPAEQTDEQPG